MMSRILKKLGYGVQGETNPLNALEKFEATPDKFDLVITDMTMPQMDGAEFSRRLKQIKPGVPIIICTGHSSTLDNQKARDLGISAYAVKPVSMIEIAKTIQEVLGHHDPPGPQ